MKKKFILLLSLILIFMLASCSAAPSTGSAASTVQTSSTANGQTSTGSTTVSSNGPVSVSVTAASAENSTTHDADDDYTWDAASAVQVTLNGDSISSADQTVNISGSTALISIAGTYSFSGNLSDGQIIVDTTDEQTVKLVLNGVELSNSTSSPIYIKNAKKVVILLVENTVNSISDAGSYILESAEENEPNAAIFSKADLSILGSGTLNVQGNYNDGISSKDGLILSGATINVTAVDDGIRGKDYIVMKDGNITIQSQGDGLKSDNEEDATKGFIEIQSGVLNITSGGDAIAAQTDVLISSGTFTLVSGGGSNSQIDATLSAKGIKGVVSVNIDAGEFTIDSADDSIHSNGSIIVNGGTFYIASGDDGIHADNSLTLNDGTLVISDSYEGLESAEITINGGTYHVNSSDDGINVAGGNDSSGLMQGPGFGGGHQGPGRNAGGAPGQQGSTSSGSTQGTTAGQDTFTATGSYILTINGGYLYIDANGDGLDSNGSIVMTNGIVLVNGPTEDMNGAIDYNSGFNITGGVLVAAGSAGMAESPDESSSQYSVLANFTSQLQAGTLVNIQNSSGETVLTFAPSKVFQSIVFSSPDLSNGEQYTIFYGGSSSGTLTDSLVEGGTYSGGSKYTDFTISSIVTRIGSTGGGGRRP